MADEMIDLSQYAQYGGPPKREEDTTENRQNTCAWCRSLTLNATQCLCYKDCGRPLCVRAPDLEPPEWPSCPKF